MPLPDLLRTKVHLTGLAGHVVESDLGYALHTPLAPTFFHGNCIVLHGPPTDVPSLRALFAREYGDAVQHALFVWGGEAPSDRVLSAARAAGFMVESDGAMSLEAPPEADERWCVRPLQGHEVDLVEALDRAADGSGGQDGDPSYVAFKRQIAELNREWIRSGKATWWGVFDDDQLMGTCGFVHCDSEIGGGIGRFQAVTVHPDHRMKGAATSLVTTVARDGFARYGCPRIVLEMDPHGPAASLYARIGFRPSGDVHSLLWSTTELNIRSEVAADEAGVHALVTAAFQPGEDVAREAVVEARIVERLRHEPGVLSMVAERNGSLLGHVLFSPVHIEASDGSATPAVALGPIAVRPEAQRTGVGFALARAGLDRCRSAGHRVCFVLGSPAYYGKFGFKPASAGGWTCQWPELGDSFQSIQLAEDGTALPQGLVRYHSSFNGS